ncbi:MAG: hypothetical protein ACKVH8_09235 [Pirellulales bacterium]|jgi:hypothetical protein
MIKSVLSLLLALTLITGCQSKQDNTPIQETTTVTLEHQLETLGQLGLTLNDGVTIDDLLYSWDREEYENEPYDMILFVLGSEIEREPWGRNICDRAWNFDIECIEATGSYVTIVNNLCRVAGKPDLITDLEDVVDFKNGKAWLKYTIDGELRHYTVPVDNDWADPDTISAVIEDIERDGKRFYAKDNGQASIWFYLDTDTADKLNVLTGNALRTNR